jgi:hypothetical protein
MRALNLGVLASMAVLMVATPGPAAAQPGVLPIANAQNVGVVEEVGYRHRYRYAIVRTIGVMAITDPTTGPTITATGPITGVATVIGPTGARASVCGLASRLTVGSPRGPKQAFALTLGEV